MSFSNSCMLQFSCKEFVRDLKETLLFVAIEKIFMFYLRFGKFPGKCINFLVVLTWFACLIEFKFSISGLFLEQLVICSQRDER